MNAPALPRVNAVRNAMRLSVRVVDSTSDFAALGIAWNRLHEQAVVASVFNSWSWQYRWWHSYGAGKSLFILVAVEAGAVVGILPLYRETVRKLGACVRLVKLVGTGGDTNPDDLGPLLARGRESAASAALAEAALRLAQLDILHLTDLDPESMFPAELEQASRRQSLSCARERCQRIVYVDLPPDWPAFLRTLSGQRRQRMRRLRRKLAASHPTRFFVWEDAENLDRAVDRLVELHRKRWRLAGGSESFASDGYIAFHREIIKACFKRGWLRLYCLRIAGEIAAMIYTYRFRNRIFLMQAGFDPQYARLSIGSVLLAHAIEHAIGEGDDVFDFLRGEHAYKDELATGCRETVSLTVSRTSLGAIAYRLREIYGPAWKARARGLIKLRTSPG